MMLGSTLLARSCCKMMLEERKKKEGSWPQVVVLTLSYDCSENMARDSTCSCLPASGTSAKHLDVIPKTPSLRICEES